MLLHAQAGSLCYFPQTRRKSILRAAEEGIAAVNGQIEHRRSGPGASRPARLISFGLLLLLSVLLPGCGGCRQTPDKEKTPEELEKELLERQKREEERKKPDFQAKFLISRPPTGSSP